MGIRTSGSTRRGTLLVLTCLLSLAAQIVMPAAAAAHAKQGTTRQTPQLMDRQKEIVLALSASPASIADKAAVYVLESSGYVKVRESQNGFTAIVQHALPMSQDPRALMLKGRARFFRAT